VVHSLCESDRLDQRNLTSGNTVVTDAGFSMLQIGAGAHRALARADRCTKTQENSSSKLRDLWASAPIS
jgi:hypothetical protein